MTDKLNVYVFGDFRSGTSSGLSEFNYQNAILLKDDFFFHFVELDLSRDKTYSALEYREEIPIYRFGTKGSSSLKLPDLFLSWINELSLENTIFHLNHIYHINNYLLAKALVKRKIPYVITPHDSYVYGPDFRKLKPFVKRMYRDIFVQIFDKYVLNHAKRIHELTDQCIPSLRLVTQTPVIVVANQVQDMNLPFDISSIKPQICYIGRFDIFQKGIDLALKGFGLFKQSNTYQNARFVLIGPATEAATATSKNISLELALEIGKDVIFTGEVSEVERNKTLSESKAYIQLSRFEGFGLSIIQALSSYKPVIVSRQIPIGDIISKYQAGYVVNNPEEASLAITEIFNLSLPEYTEMCQRARECYEKEFSPAVVKPQLAELYN